MTCRYLTVIACAVSFLLGCSADETEALASGEARVRATCSRCHRFPPPEALPKALWRAQIEHMANLSSEMTDLFGEEHEPLSVEEAVTWYESRAPEEIRPERSLTRPGAGPLAFELRLALLGPGSGPGVATVDHIPTDGPMDRLLAANMMHGTVHGFTLTGGPELIGSFGNPVRVSAADLDLDGEADYVISDLGHPLPTEEPAGRVGVARRSGSSGYAIETVLSGIGRVSDVLAKDLDADGDTDLVVASFGALRSGGIYVLHNRDPKELRFEVEHVSSQPGAVRVVAGDPDAGLDADFVAGFSQHLESVTGFRQEAGGWTQHTLFQAPHPSWGMSSIEPADLDRDGDLDLLIANGDTLDAGFPWRPYQGVGWLENDGAGQLTYRRIGTLYGAHGVKSVDLDGDGDLDVVASGFLPQVQPPLPPNGPRIESLVWYERTEDGFDAWALEEGHPRHTGVDVADVNGDGRPDVVAGINTAWDDESRASGASIELWLNRGPSSSPGEVR